MSDVKTPGAPSPRKSTKKAKSAPKHAETKQKRRSLHSVLCLAIVLLLVFVGTSIYANNYDKIYPNTYIYDTKVSDMSEAELSSYLAETYSVDKIKGSSVLLTCNTQDLQLDVDNLNIQYDNQSFAQEILSSGKDGNFITNTVAFVKRFFVPTVLEPVITYDAQALSNAFNEVAAGFEVEPVGHTFFIGDNKVTINGPVNGLKADRAKAVAEAERQIKTMAFSNIDLKPEPVTPDPIDFDTFYSWLTSEAENAYYEKVDGVVKVHPSKAKVEVDRQVVEEALNNLKTSATNTIDIDAVTIQAEITADHLTEILYSNQLSTYSTNFGGSSAARANNVRLAASRINGTELMPGEEFSYDKTILSRTAANGYMSAPVYVGNKVESGMGGGICQPSSTLYVAALYANLEILERHNHSLKVSYLPPGLDATIAEGYLDLRFRNNSDYPVKINASAEGGVLTFTIMGYNPNNTKVELVRGTSGATYLVTRVVYENGAEIKREAMGSSVYGTPEPDEPEPAAPSAPQTQESNPSSTPQAETQPEAPSTPQPETPAPTPSPAPAETPAPPQPAAPAESAPQVEN